MAMPGNLFPISLMSLLKVQTRTSSFIITYINKEKNIFLLFLFIEPMFFLNTFYEWVLECKNNFFLVCLL